MVLDSSAVIQPVCRGIRSLCLPHALGLVVNPYKAPLTHHLVWGGTTSAWIIALGGAQIKYRGSDSSRLAFKNAVLTSVPEAPHELSPANRRANLIDKESAPPAYRLSDSLGSECFWKFPQITARYFFAVEAEGAQLVFQKPRPCRVAPPRLPRHPSSFGPAGRSLLGWHPFRATTCTRLPWPPSSVHQRLGVQVRLTKAIGSGGDTRVRQLLNLASWISHSRSSFCTDSSLNRHKEA